MKKLEQAVYQYFVHILSLVKGGGGGGGGGLKANDSDILI